MPLREALSWHEGREGVHGPCIMGGGGRLDGVNLNFELPRLSLEATVKVTYAAHLVPFMGSTQTKPFKMQRLIHINDSGRVNPKSCTSCGQIG